MPSTIDERGATIATVEDRDPRVACGALRDFADRERDDAIFERLLRIAEKMAARETPGPTADELEKVLTRWARDESERRRVASVFQRLADVVVPTELLPLAEHAPEWLTALASRKARTHATRWEWAHAAAMIAAFHPEQLLPYLTALRPLGLEIRQGALDRAMERLGVAAVDRPTLAECQAALEIDPAPRPLSVYSNASGASTRDVEPALVAFVLDALGCEAASMRRTVDAPVVNEEGWETVTTETSRLESTSCMIRIETCHTNTPGDVNEPPRHSAMLRIEGTRTGGPTIKLSNHEYSRDVLIDVTGSSNERHRILMLFARAFARSADEWKESLDEWRRSRR